MSGRPKKTNREKDFVRAFEAGEFDDDNVEAQERFGDKSKHYQHHKTIRTQDARSSVELDKLPLGEVIQVHSLFSEVLYNDIVYRCTQRKTLSKISNTQMIVGDRVRFTIAPELNDKKAYEASVEVIEPRKTVLARADSFKARDVHPIVANAGQMLIVAALHLPEVKWGLIDRMVIAARSGGLDPIVCLNKIDTAANQDDLDAADAALAHYETLGVRTLKTCAIKQINIDVLQSMLKDHVTVLAGHSGVGKSTLVKAIEPGLDIRIGDISAIHSKGMHTTTSARRYALTIGGYVIDTPGVKLFGLWQVARDALLEYFPDVEADTAPEWRKESYQRILKSL
ncbi:MAG: ribosome small subunit-dependent GTPase A [Burkholderiales bacterium]|nr:ribosome small subunit-dependent GTPase A [Phycisphaerae bacterium]